MRSSRPMISAALPTSQTLPPESDGQFRVSVEGADPIRIQWVYNGTQSLENQTNGLLTLTNMDLSFQGLYQAIASNIYGAATTSPVAIHLFSFYPLTVASITDGGIEVRPPTGPYRNPRFPGEARVHFSRQSPAPHRDKQFYSQRLF